MGYEIVCEFFNGKYYVCKWCVECGCKFGCCVCKGKLLFDVFVVLMIVLLYGVYEWCVNLYCGAFVVDCKVIEDV